MHANLRGSSNFLILYQIDFPCLPDEIAEPRPDMNSKVAAFTVSKKSINISFDLLQNPGWVIFFSFMCKKRNYSEKN